MERVYTVKQTAELLNVGKKAVYELISQNKLKAVRVGRSLRIPEQCMDEYMNLTANKQKSLRELELEKEIDFLKHKLATYEDIRVTILNVSSKIINL
jgi:excisionase family DNA binding protein